MHKHSVLIVENEPVIVEYLRVVLTRYGYRVSGVASSGNVALQLARLLSPDLVLMDVFISGGMDGIETARQIRDQTGAKIVFITAFEGEEVRNRAMELEPAGYLLKPFRPDRLVAVIKSALSTSETR